MKKKHLETIYEAICYFNELINGGKPTVSVEDFSKEELNEIHRKLRKKLLGF